MPKTIPVILTTVVNLKTDPYDVYIGRGSLFGNPFRITETDTRRMVIANYEAYFLGKIKDDEWFRKQVVALRGKRLGCYCAPLRCHGDVIVKWLKEHNDIP